MDCIQHCSSFERTGRMHAETVRGERVCEIGERTKAVVSFIHGCIQKTITSHLQQFLPQGSLGTLR
eukprot:5275509-Amphidinium_carterae.1